MDVSIDEMLLLVGAKEVELAKLRVTLADIQARLSTAESELVQLRPTHAVPSEGNNGDRAADRPRPTERDVPESQPA